MAWGDAFKSAWNKATDVACSAAAALATGAKKVKKWVIEKAKQAKKTAITAIDWTKKKADEVKKWAVKKAADIADTVKDKVIKTHQAVKKIYNAVKKTFTTLIAGIVKTGCAAKQAVVNTVKKGLDGAQKERDKKKPKGDYLSQFFDAVKPSAEAEWKKPYPKKEGWGSKKSPEDPLKPELKIAASVSSKKHDERVLYYGDESNNLQIGAYGGEVKHGIAYNPEKREYTADIVDISGYVSAARWKTKHSLGERDLATFETQVDALSLEGKGRIGATWGPDKKEAIAEISLAIDLIKGQATGTLNITPKSIWDNTIGRLSYFGKAPDWLDHGISLQTTAEAGIGAGGSAEGGVKEGKFVLGASLGFGIKLGFKLGLGFK